MIESLFTIFLLHWVMLLTPGPNVLLVSALAAAGDVRAAIFAGLGITTVAGIWASLAAVGVHAVFAAHPQLRVGLQVAGALYLLYVSAQLWRSGTRPQGRGGGPATRIAAWRLGFMTNIGNPKSALFFGSAFAATLPAQPGASLAMLAIALVVANALAWHLALALVLSRAPVRKLYAAHGRFVARTAAILVGSFALRLIADAWQPIRSWAGTD